MAIWYKINGTWTQVQKPYIKRTGIHRPARKVYVKVAGVWEEAYEHDTTPPAVPLVSLQVIDNRWIQVGARTPGGSHDTDLKRIRVLVSREAPLGTQFGSGFIATKADSHPKEPWSDWWYNNLGTNGWGRDDSSVETYKRYPVNADAETNLPGGKWYYFAAWSEDRNGNWSVANQTKIWMPAKNPDATRGVVQREARIQAKNAGSRTSAGTTYTDGELIVRESPASNVFFYHGNQFTEAIGSRGTPTIKSAQIRITRGDDVGQATANVHLFWHEAADYTVNTANAGRLETTLVGTINKGESKWFNIPESHWGHLKNETKGFGLAYGTLASDYLVLPDLGIDMRNGEVNVVWEEEL